MLHNPNDNPQMFMFQQRHKKICQSGRLHLALPEAHTMHEIDH